MPYLANGRTVVHTRDEWGARRPRSITRVNPTFGSTDHWAGGRCWSATNMGDHTRCASLLRGFQNFHMDGRGWSDIAYNFAVCPHGVGYELRGPTARSGANGTNAGNASALAVLWIIGQGDSFTSGIRSTMARAAFDVMVYARMRGAGPRRNGHRDWKSTACPGDAIYSISKSNWTPNVTPTQPATGEPATGGTLATAPARNKTGFHDVPDNMWGGDAADALAWGMAIGAVSGPAVGNNFRLGIDNANIEVRAAALGFLRAWVSTWRAAAKPVLPMGFADGAYKGVAKTPVVNNPQPGVLLTEGRSVAILQKAKDNNTL